MACVTLSDTNTVEHRSGQYLVTNLRHVKAVQDFSAGCSTNIGPQIDVPFIK